jgi:hypothetical protein
MRIGNTLPISPCRSRRKAPENRGFSLFRGHPEKNLISHPATPPLDLSLGI